jgi:hypothetical protein
MIKNLKVGTMRDSLAQRDNEIYDYLKQLESKKGRKLSILDVGGGCSIRLPNTTHVLDFLPLRDAAKDQNVSLFLGNIDLTDGWTEVFEYVKQNGKFDFVVCSHTLEDINSSEQVILNLFKVADAGMIALPTKYIETIHWETYYLQQPYMGYGHHKWIYTVKNNTLYAYPKMGHMEYVKFNFSGLQEYLKRYSNQQTEMTFLWENDFSFKFVQPFQYLNHFELTETKQSAYLDLMEKDDVCKLFVG